MDTENNLTQWCWEHMADSFEGVPQTEEEALRRLQEAHAVMSVVFSVLSIDFHSVYYINLDEDFLVPYRLSPEMEEEFGDYLRQRPSYLQAMTGYASLRVRPAEREAFLAAMHPDSLREKTLDGKPFVYEYRNERNGENRFFQVKVVRIPGESGCRVVMAFADVNNLRKEELEYYSYVDQLTGGHNYTYFKEQLQRNEQRPLRDFYIIAMDIHSFKTVNAVCGPRTGDKVLRAIWREIEQSLPAESMAAHINADHFVLSSPLTDEEAIRAWLQRLTLALCRLPDQLETPHIAPYFGVALLQAGDEVETVYGRARLAKNKIRLQTDNNVAFFNRNDSEHLQQEQGLENDFRRALTQRSFEVWYQPKFNTRTDELVGAEALVRWRRKDGSILPPGKFIPLFERNGLIRALDLYVFRTVCYQQKIWEAEKRPLWPISVNLSRASLSYPDVVERYARIIRAAHVDQRLVPLEITESATLDSRSVFKLVSAFREAGFVLHMDDFGAGYSSLSLLNTNYFDTLKLDKSLVDYIGDYRGSRLLGHTITLAKELGLQVVAEGVETLEQVRLLRSMDCDYIQGYFYARPLPLAEFEVLCDKGNGHPAEEEKPATTRLKLTDIRRILLDMRFSDAALEDMLGALAFYRLKGSTLEVMQVNEAYCHLAGLGESIRTTYRTGLPQLMSAEEYARLLDAFRRAEQAYPHSVRHAGTYRREDGSTFNCGLHIYYLRTWNGAREYFASLRLLT